LKKLLKAGINVCTLKRPDNMARLLVVVNIFHPDRGGGAAVFSDLCYTLVQRGFEVTVRCAYPYYPEWQDKSGRNGWHIWRYQDQGVTVERYGLFIPRNPNSLWQRLLYEASFFASLLRSVRHGKSFDLVLVYCPLMGALAFTVLHKWLYGQPLWLNVQDLPADAGAATGISRSGLVNRLLRGVQRALFNQADLWSSISPVMIERLQAIRRRGQPVLYLPNWLNASLAAEIQSLPSKVGRLPSHPVQLLYAGNIGAKQGLLRFCTVLQRSSASFQFRIQGNGGGAEALRTWILRTGDARFHFGPFLDEAGFARALHEADFFIIPEKPGSGDSFIPSKLIPGMASGTPILAVCDAQSPLGQEMHTAQPGPWFPWTAVDTISLLMQNVANDRARYLLWQANALQHARSYDREHVIDRFAATLRALAEQKGLTDQDLSCT